VLQNQCSVSGNNYVSGLTCASEQKSNFHSCKVQQTKLIIDKDDKCTGKEQNHAARKLNPTSAMEYYNSNNPSISRLLPHKQFIKIYHQNMY
jgi:hypothetical protein